MTTKTSSLTSVSRARSRGPNNPRAWNRPKIAFVSRCPRCGHERFQHGYTRRGLFVLLNTGRSINAYCIVCNVCWPISERERHAISAMKGVLQTRERAAPATSQQRESRHAARRNETNSLESQGSLQRASLVLRAIRQRYEVGRNEHPDARCYSVHVAVDYGDMAWITAAIETLEKAIAAGPTQVTA